MPKQKKKIRRTRSPHPGVVILKRRDTDSRRVTYRARYVDPDSRKTIYLSLTKQGIKNEEGPRSPG